MERQTTNLAGYSTAIMRVLIIANGVQPAKETVKSLALRSDVVIAVDGAVYAAVDAGLHPDIMTGDFDSVRLESVRAEFPKLRIVPTPDQDQSDLEKAVNIAHELGASSITIIGAAGGRMDHTLANMALLLEVATPICIVDDFGTVQAARSDCEADSVVFLETAVGDTVSLITFDPNASVSITGVKWPLSRCHLLPGTRGVSNVALGNAVQTVVHKGAVFVCHLYEASIREHSRF